MRSRHDSQKYLKESASENPSFLFRGSFVKVSGSYPTKYGLTYCILLPLRSRLQLEL